MKKNKVTKEKFNMEENSGEDSKQAKVIYLIEQFERFAALILVIIVSLIVAVSVYRVSSTVINALLVGEEDPLSYVFFQKTFGQIMTVLIAIEFNHTIIQIARRIENAIQIKIVLLVAMLALSRKFIILDLAKVTPPQMYALAAIMVSLGVVYWLVLDKKSNR